MPGLQKSLILVVAIALAAATAAVQVISVRDESPTWDEGFEIGSGYSYLKTGDYRISQEQPPLARMIAALPLLHLNPRVPVEHSSWTNPNDREFGAEFLFHNRVSADQIVFDARMPTVATTLALGLGLLFWTRRVFGAWAGLGALALFALDPNVIANGRYVKNDMLVTALCFLCVAVWGRYLENGKQRWAAATGLIFGLAFATKFSALFLIPVFPVTWILSRWQQKRALAPLRCAVVTVGLLALAGITAIAVYAPSAQKLIPATRAYRAAHPEVRRLGDAMHVFTPRATAVLWISTKLGLQDHPLLKGFTIFLDHATGGHRSYLLGKFSETGWWYYFPVAFLVKTPVATLGALLIATFLGLRRLISAPPGWLRSLPREWLLLLVPIAFYLPVSMVNNVNTGERHLLPVYPFLFALTAAILTRARWPGRIPVTAALAILLAIESASIYPSYLAFFNFAVGGPDAGPRYLLDSNLDWGQDYKHVASYIKKNHIHRVCTLYFGTVPTSAYEMDPEHGVEILEVPGTDETADRASVDCVAAVSVTPLMGLYVGPARLAWLRERKPDTTIGHSIYIYDLRKTANQPR